MPYFYKGKYEVYDIITNILTRFSNTVKNTFRIITIGSTSKRVFNLTKTKGVIR